MPSPLCCSLEAAVPVDAPQREVADLVGLRATSGSASAFGSDDPRPRDARAWVREIANLTEPDAIVWCDGSAAEKQRLTDLLVDAGTLLPLDPDDSAVLDRETFDLCLENRQPFLSPNHPLHPLGVAQLNALREFAVIDLLRRLVDGFAEGVGQ